MSSPVLMEVGAEGEEKPSEKDIIDVNYSRLLEWVTSRKLVRSDWVNQLSAVRSKIAAALDRIPDNADVGPLPSPNLITYTTCAKIIELLQRTESSEKAMFGWGGFKSKTLNSWASIVSDYEKSLLFIAEASQHLSRMVDFEYPALKKDVTRAEGQIQEICKKRADQLRTANEFEMKYKAMCSDLSIEGSSVGQLEKEICETAAKLLPEAFEEVTVLLQEPPVREATEYYGEFVRFSLQASELPVKGDDIELTKLDFIVKHGNVPYKEFVELLDGAEVEVTYESVPTASTTIGNRGIDFGGGGIDFEGDGGIDFGGTDAGSIDFGGGDGSIDFGVDVGGIDFGGADTNGGIDFGDSGGIDFGDSGGIDLGAADDSSGIDWSAAMVLESSGVEKVKMTEKEAKASLLNTQGPRSDVMNELLELSAFLESRIMDSESKSSTQSFNEFHSAPTILQQTGIEQLQTWCTQVKAVLALLNSAQTRQLIQIDSSSGHVKRLADKLAMQKKHSKRFRGLASDQDAKEQALRETLQQQSDSLKALVGKVRDMKGFVENALGEQKGYSECVFQLVGAINSVR